ncbi:MAG: hypothetical protein DSY90_08830 [Deltaproteobacteria bacterium]|nr:MAG: hypothetical protein DSY90_08830 [Deltaproteobacteria bacterium]
MIGYGWAGVTITWPDFARFGFIRFGFIRFDFVYFDGQCTENKCFSQFFNGIGNKIIAGFHLGKRRF